MDSEIEFSRLLSVIVLSPSVVVIYKAIRRENHPIKKIAIKVLSHGEMPKTDGDETTL